MVRIGVVIVIGAIIVSMAAGMYMYTEYQTNFIQGKAGEIIKVGPVEYTITFEGTNKGDKDTTPEKVFVKIGISAKNTGDEKTLLSGGQFYIVDSKEQKYEAVFGEFSEKDLLLEWIEPGQTIEKSTQFDIDYHENEQYKIIIRPQKTQSTVDTAVICLTNC
jgi:hypothetical protein